MPTLFFPAVSFSLAQPKKGAGSPPSLTSVRCSCHSSTSMLAKLPRVSRGLLSITIALSIFAALPRYVSAAEFDLPGMQAPGAGTASFDRKESVLDRFRANTKKKDQAALEGLFTRWDPVFSQSPAVVLSDGATVAHITLRLQGRAGDPPNFSVSGGHCISAKMTDNGSWSLDIRPNRGSLATSLTVAFSGQMTEYPLTVAPPLNLFDPRTADPAVADYVTTANRLAAPATIPERK